MSGFMKKHAMKQAGKLFQANAASMTPLDPVYEEHVDARGKTRRVKRELPPGLSKRDQRILKKVKRRARRLDRGMNLCGFRVGYTFWLSLVPVVGDVADMLLNYFLVLRVAKQADIPDWLFRKMVANNAVSASFSFIPVAGDIFLGLWKANSRNALLLEQFLAKRGQEALAAQGAAAGVAHAGAGEKGGRKWWGGKREERAPPVSAV